MRSHATSSQQRACTRSTGGLQACRVIARPAARLRVAAMQSGSWAPQPQQQQQPLPPQQQQQPPLPQQQQPMPQQQASNPMQQQGGVRPGAAPLARTAPQAPYQQQGGGGGVFLELTQVLNKQVITRTSGRCLGTISGAWMDPGSGALVSFDLDERRQGSGGGGLGLSSPARAGNIPLTALRQIGDVVLVHDEAGLYEQDLDGRLGFVNPVGLGVVTRAGDFLGKVRDLSFSPDSGAIRRVTYDEFGLPFLPLSFFDCYSVAMADVLSIGRGELLVYDDAKYRERKESAGLFAAIPSLLKSLNGPARGGGGGGPQLALPAPGSTSDMYRLGAGPGSTAGRAAGSSSSRFLPTDYTYEQWQADLRRWEAETGMTYEQYLRSQGQVAPRTALPPGGSSAAAPGYASAGGGYGAPQQPRPPQQQQQASYQQQPQQPLYQQQQPVGQPAAPQWQQPQQQQRYSQQYPAGPGQQQAGAWPGAQAAAPAAAPPRGYGGPQQQQQPVYGGMHQQQQPPQQQQRVQQPPLRQQQQRGANAAAAPQQQQQQRPAAAAAAAGVNRPAPTAQQPRPQQPQSEQQQQQNGGGGGGSGRPVDEWMDRETRPRIADALADGVLPSSDDVPQPTAAAPTQQPVVQQEVA